MKFRARFTEVSKADFRQIRRIIAKDKPRRAVSFVKELRAACHVWAEYPMAGRDRSEFMEGMRSFPHGNYLIFYLPEPDGLLVLRVVHGARDLPSLFQ